MIKALKVRMEVQEETCDVGSLEAVRFNEIAASLNWLRCGSWVRSIRDRTGITTVALKSSSDLVWTRSHLGRSSVFVSFVRCS